MGSPVGVGPIHMNNLSVNILTSWNKSAMFLYFPLQFQIHCVELLYRISVSVKNTILWISGEPTSWRSQRYHFCFQKVPDVGSSSAILSIKFQWLCQLLSYCFTASNQPSHTQLWEDGLGLCKLHFCFALASMLHLVYRRL